jgi:hypothetical protein
MEREWFPNDLARWLRRRRKTRVARETGQSVGMDPDFYDEGEHRRDETPPIGCLIILIIIIIVLFGSCWVVFRGDDTAEIIGSPITISTSSSSTGSEGTAAPQPTSGTQAPPATQQSTTGDPILDGILRAIDIDLDPEAGHELLDLVRDAIDSLSGRSAAYQGSEIDIARSWVMMINGGAAFQLNAFGNTVYPCGASDPLVACATDVLDMPAGETLVVAVRMDADIQTTSTERSYIYSIVFDSDGDPANDWVFNPPFDWDYFQGADRWYQAIYDHTTGEWWVDVTQLTADGSFPQLSEASSVRLVVDGPWAVWFIPTTEFEVYPAPFRVTAFAHDGFYSESSRGGDVMGADPTEPLVVPPTEPAFVSGG